MLTNVLAFELLGYEFRMVCWGSFLAHLLPLLAAAEIFSWTVQCRCWSKQNWPVLSNMKKGKVTRGLLNGKAPSSLPSWPRSCGLYLGVWARVKRRRWRLMLRFISSFLKSSGEFRGDPRGESLGELFGDPAGEPALVLGMSWMIGGQVTLCSCGLSSTSECSSSEFSEHRSLIVNRGWSGVRWFAPSVFGNSGPRNCLLTVSLWFLT